MLEGVLCSHLPVCGYVGMWVCGFVWVCGRYTIQQLYAVVADVSNYKYFVPYCVDSRVIKQLGVCVGVYILE